MNTNQQQEVEEANIMDDSNEVKAMVGKPIEEIRLRKLMK